MTDKNPIIGESGPEIFMPYSELAARNRFTEDAVKGALALRRIWVGEWKFLRECTKADILVAAENAMKRGNGLRLIAQRWETLASAMTAKQTVDDLPAKLVAEALRVADLDGEQ